MALFCSRVQASTRSSSKRSASQADLPNTDVAVLAPEQPSLQSAAAAAPPAAPASEVMSDGNPLSNAELLAAGGPAPQPQIEGFTHPVPTELAAADGEETTGHKAKRLATEAAHTVQTAVTQGLESASVVLSQAAEKAKELGGQALADAKVTLAHTKEWSDRELVRTQHSMGNATAANPPYNMAAADAPVPTEPTLRDKVHNTLNTIQFASQDAAEQALAAAKVAGHKISEVAHSALVGAGNVVPMAVSGAEQLKEGVAHLSAQAQAKAAPAAESIATSVKSGATQLAAGAQATAAQLKTAVTHTTGSEDKQVSGESHWREKKEGSLPVERNADEFPHAKHERHTPILQPGQSGLGTDVAAGSAMKVDELPITKAQEAQIEPGTVNAPINI